MFCFSSHIQLFWVSDTSLLFAQINGTSSSTHLTNLSLRRFDKSRIW